MAFVVDASVAANWFLPDEEPEAIQAWDRLTDDPGLVPLHWWFEVHNLLLMAERRQRISPHLTLHILDRLARLRITLMPLPEVQSVLAIAQRSRLTFYDAAYLELALRENVPIATLDRVLASAAILQGVPLILPHRSL